MSNKVKALTPRQMELYALLDGKGDVPIPDLYKGYYARNPKAAGHASVRKMQAALGWPIATLNSRLHHMKQRVAPGDAHQTYRLIVG